MQIWRTRQATGKQDKKACRILINIRQVLSSAICHFCHTGVPIKNPFCDFYSCDFYSCGFYCCDFYCCDLSSAWPISAIRSSASSIPTERRRESGKTPALAFSSGVCPKWVEDSGCTIRLLASPTFADIEQMIHKYYDTDNPEKEQLREFAFLDSSRHPEYPDDLAVFLLHEDHKPERVWVRGGHLSENEIHGTLLNEPNADFGVHCGDSIPIIPYKQEDESIVCVSPPGK